jgi:hypothetical protein
MDWIGNSYVALFALRGKQLPWDESKRRYLAILCTYGDLEYRLKW